MGTVLRSHGALIRNLCEPICVSLRPLRQCDAYIMTSRCPGHALNAPISDHQWSESDLITMILRLRRPQYAALALPLRLLRAHGVCTTILRRPSAFRCMSAVTCAICQESTWLVTFCIGKVSTGVVTSSALRCGVLWIRQNICQITSVKTCRSGRQTVVRLYTTQ